MNLRVGTFFPLIIFAFTISAATEKPNIVVIYTDDHGWPDIGATGIYDDLKTPHIDALAASGVRATNGYSTAPQCVPSRAGLLTGRAQNRFGLESNPDSLDGFNAELTIAERLKAAGYATGQIGKWHLGATNEITAHGFDDVYSKNSNRPCSANFTLDGKTIPMQQVDDRMYHLDACSEAAVTFIDRHVGEPFFLYLAYRAPHVPLDATEKYLDRFPGEMPERRRQALAMISAMDDGVGKIVAKLKEHGLSKNTLIFFIGDNGAPLKIHKHDAPGGGPGWDGSLNKPMNGEKGMLAEGGIRVPFLVAWPGKIPGGQIYDHPVTALDVAATATELAGLDVPENKLDGVNLVPFFTGDRSGAPHSFLTWRWIAQSAIREGKWKLLIGGSREYLFDLDADPGESNNLILENKGTADRLRKQLMAWGSELNPPGIETTQMAGTWEQYFDFYLDGKPAPPLRTKSEIPAPGSVQGWISRNSKLTSRPGSLGVESSHKNPFLVKNGLKLQGKFTATIKLRVESPGHVGISWRMDGQKDFEKKNSVSTKVEPVPDYQEVELKIPAEGKTIHIRLHLPKGKTSVREIMFQDTFGVRPKWNFSNQKQK